MAGNRSHRRRDDLSPRNRGGREASPRAPQLLAWSAAENGAVRESRVVFHDKRRVIRLERSARTRDAGLWLESGLMDVEFYAALRGCSFGDAMAAAADFVDRGMSNRLSPHPLLDFASLPREVRKAWRQGRVAQVLGHLTGDDGQIRPAGPLAAVEPEVARAAMLSLAKQLGREEEGPGDLGPAAADWPAVGERELRRDRISAIVVAADPKRTVRAVERALRHAEGRDFEVIVVDRGSEPHVALHLCAALQASPDVQLLRLPRAVPDGAAVNFGVIRATGATAVLLQPHVLVRRGWLGPALAPLENPQVAGVQPVVLRRDDTIDSAGLVVTEAGRPPWPLLAGHQKEDALRLREQPVTATARDVMVLRTRDLIELKGVDARSRWREASLDLCARLIQRRAAGFRVASASLVTSTEADAHENRTPPFHGVLPADPGVLERIGFYTDGTDPPTVTGRRRVAANQLRWSIKLPSSPGAGGDKWGDTHFADALARALRDLGQDVVTCRRGAHSAGPTHLDDVSLAIRGLYPIPPTPGQRNILWVISHPDDVDPREFDGYDIVCAASGPWSAELSVRTGRQVVPLLQASEFEPPATKTSGKPPRRRVVFVGNNGVDRERPLVWKAVEAGVPLAVYGKGWEDLPDGAWRGEYVDNSCLPDLYHGHGVVLADHWPDMARHGFIANRVFDAVASGARVICDDVAGVHDVFDACDVTVARSPEDIREAVEQWCILGPVSDDGPRTSLTFHDRARTLLGEVLSLGQSSEGGRRRG